MALLLWTILVATLGLIWYFRRSQAKKQRLGKLKEPPGPRGLPILGNLHQIGTQASKQFCKWTEQYGDIYQIRFGNQKAVLISDPKLHKEIFSDPNTTGRLVIKEFEMYPDTPGLGILASVGERWEVHRRFLLRQLREFGFGKSSMQALITDELKETIEMFKKKAGTPVGRIRETLRLAVVNSLWAVVTSKRFKQDDPELLRLSNNTTEKFDEVFTKGRILFFMPWLRHIIPEASGYNAIRQVFDEIRLFMEETVEEKKRNLKDGELNDFIDAYLTEMKNAENDPASLFHGELAKRQLVTTLADLFIAGSDSTATSTAWSILYLSKYPAVQKKLQQEITDITGDDSRMVSLDDRPNMPYACALVEELLRFSSINGDGVPHLAKADIEFHGYLIEKNSLIQPNLYYIHHNPKIWGDPQNFRPERFLSADGTKFVKNENLQAFQVGRRQCVGETSSRDTIFLFVISLFQQFSMEFNPNEEEPSLEAAPAFLRVPLPYTVVMKDRLNK